MRRAGGRALAVRSARVLRLICASDSGRHAAAADRDRERIKRWGILQVNGSRTPVDLDGDVPLLWVLRDDLGLDGNQVGCGVAQCGACTVHVDGRAARSCVGTGGSASRAASIVTIEGVSGKVAEAVQGAWRRLDVAQCGYCQSGQIMSAIALLSEMPQPTDADIDAAMTGNVCRCATYVRIRAAIHDAARTLGGLSC